MNQNNSRIRDAATVVLVRDRTSNPRILVGQRGDRAVFMPSKFVFPGGAVDQADRAMLPQGFPGPVCMERLAHRSGLESVDPLLLCAVREVWEETGLRLAVAPAQPARIESVPPGWRKFCVAGLLPSARGLVYFYRAITPPGRTRRFDARFFVGDIDNIPLIGDPDDFGNASDELANLQWVSLADIEDFDIPYITRLVIAELRQVLRQDLPPARIPFRFEEDGIHKVEFL